MHTISNPLREAGSAHLVLLALLVLVAVAGCGYFVWNTDHKTPVAATTQTSTPPTTTASTAGGSPSSYAPPSLSTSSTSNQTLNSDMQSINTTVNQDNRHVQSTSQSFSDKPDTITN